MKHYKKLLCLITIGILAYSCQNDDNEITPQNTAEEQNYLNSENEDGIIKLGKKLENPYAIGNMSLALENLKKSNKSAKSLTDEIEVTTTHLYVKFIPKTENELDILKRDSTLILYGYPLDYEIEEGGYFYHDPAVPQNQPTYQYAAIKVDKELPNEIENEILAELFIPDEDSDLENKTSKKSVTYQMVDALVDEALRITNNLEETLQNKSLKTTRSKWRPAGTIKVWDDVVGNFIGVEGVKVRARRWFTTHRGIANATGYYSCDGRFRRDANYSIDWERYQFALQDGWLNGATYNGPKKRGNWDLNLDSGEQEYYATIFSGAYFYYYGTRMGLTSPPTNAILQRQMKIAARKKTGTSSHIHQRRLIHSAPIYIKRYGNNSQLVFGTTIHELAHAAHWNMGRASYNNLGFDGYIGGNDGDKRTLETWATTVEIVLTNNRYRTRLDKPNYNYLGNLQRQTIPEENFYTTAGFDMIDDVNQRTEIFPLSNLRPIDRVSGYTINELENGLRGAKSWTEWRDNIKSRSENPTEDFVDELFNNWE